MRNPAQGGASVSLAGDAEDPTPRAPSRQAKWQAANPKARWAHIATQSGLRRGLITRQPCEECGAEPTDAHHESYDRPLDVRWLCRRCHIALHKKAASNGSRYLGGTCSRRGPLWACIDEDALCTTPVVAERKFPAFVAPFLDEAEARQALLEAGADPASIAGEPRRARG